MKITRNAFSLLAGRASSELLNLVLFVTISRQMGPAGVGTYSYGLALAALCYAATTLGIDAYGVREYTRRSGPERAHLLAQLLGAQFTVAAAVLVLLSGYLLVTRPSAEALGLVWIFTSYQLGAAIGGTLFVPSMGEQRMLLPAMVTLGSRAAAFVVAMTGLLLWRTSLMNAVVGFALAGPLIALLAARSARRHVGRFGVELSVTVLRESTRALWSFAGIDLLALLLTRAGIVLLTLLATATDAGLYATGLKLIEVACIPLAYLGIAAYPRLCSTFRDDGPAYARLARRLLGLAAGLGLVFALGMFFVVPGLLVPVLGPRFAGAEGAIRLMAPLALLQGLELTLGRLLVAANLQTKRVAILALSGGCTVVAHLTLIPRSGIEGAIGATALGYVIAGGLYACGFASVWPTLRARSGDHPTRRSGR